MTSLKPTSKKIHAVSKTTKPNKKKKFTGVVTAKNLAMRTGPGASFKTVSLSPLSKGVKVKVCDAILSKKIGAPTYYISIKGRYGYVSAKYIKITEPKKTTKTSKPKKTTKTSKPAPKKTPKSKSTPKKTSKPAVNKNAKKFLDNLATYHEFVKRHPSKFYYHYDGSVTSFGIAKSRVEHGKSVGITCVVPIRWALKATSVKRADGKSLIHAVKGTFKNSFNGPAKNKLTRITKGSAVGYTIKQAVDKDLLKPGDILCFKNRTHTFAYSGVGYKVYEGGHANIRNGHYPYGIMPDYSKRNKAYKIGEILRWK